MTALDDALESAKARSIASLERPTDRSHRRLQLRRLTQGAAADFRETWWKIVGTWYVELDDEKELWRYVAECVDAALEAWGYAEPEGTQS